DQVTACFFGEGTANRGTFLEGVNMAALYKLPVIFFCENNGYGFSTSRERAMANEKIADRAPGLGLPGKVVDGNDVLAVYRVTQKAVERARAGEGPTLIEGMTYRWRGHHERDPGTAYRSSKELEGWKRKCPLVRLKKTLLEKKWVTRENLAGIEEKVRQEVEEAVNSSKAGVFPDPGDMEKCVAYYDFKPKPRL
ncbi:MAG: thiamine pyrophosphate-dependent dehydrogenase E1 component subunit alpha, partial [Deltaproteobacteria bacterium]|nr:thiamine pyrophosphate-dependent dehydrogenase E1 component subunit alpha [Deltaproteobacteria bacterium]